MYLLLVLCSQFLFQPVLAGNETLHDIGNYIVASGVDHGGGGIHQVAQGDGDGVSDGQLIREEDGAQHQLAGTAAAGNAGHGNGGEHSHDDGQDGFAGAEILTEDAEEEGHLDDGAHGAAVHVHGGTQGQHDVGHILGNAGLFRGFHVGGDGGNRGAGAEGHRRRLEQMAEHDTGALLAAAEPGVNGEEHQHIGKAQHIVDDQGAAVVADELGAVGGDEVGEEAEEADGGIVGDDLNHLHNAVCHIGQELGGHGFLTAGHLDAKTAEDGKDDEGQDGPAAPKLREVGLGEEVDDHVRKTQGLAHFALGGVVLALDQGEDPADDVHDDGGDACGDHECTDGDTHDLACLFHGVHVGNGRGDGAEHHRNHNAEHQINKYSTQGLQDPGAGLQNVAVRILHRGEDGAHDTAGHDTGQHEDQKAVIFQKFLYHGFYLLKIACLIEVYPRIGRKSTKICINGPEALPKGENFGKKS